jgi:hypothetical protein
VWRSGAEKAAGRGVADGEIGKSLVAVGLERWLASEPAEQVAGALVALAKEIFCDDPPASLN